MATNYTSPVSTTKFVKVHTESYVLWLDSVKPWQNYGNIPFESSVKVQLSASFFVDFLN
jgi:hypothetical protein